MLADLKLQIDNCYSLKPFRIAFIDDNEVIVLHSRFLSFVSVKDTLELVQTVHLPYCLFDVCYLKAGFLAAISNNCVHFIDMSFDITKIVGGSEDTEVVFQKPRMITAVSSDTVVVFDAGHMTSFCIDTNGHIVWRFADDRIPVALCGFENFLIFSVWGPKLLVLTAENGEQVGKFQWNDIHHSYAAMSIQNYAIITEREQGIYSTIYVYKCVVDNIMVS